MQKVEETPTTSVGKREVKTKLTLVQLAKDQMKCFDRLHDLFGNIDAKMCEANNATSNNSDCWNGREFGR